MAPKGTKASILFFFLSLYAVSTIIYRYWASLSGMLLVVSTHHVNLLPKLLFFLDPLLGIINQREEELSTISNLPPSES